MGGISTSHSASLSNHKASASKEFDLRNWRGLTDLLRVGRESIPDPRAYAEFRNLVLGYAQRGGDAEIRRNIDTIVATFGKNKGTEEQTEKVIEIKREVPREKAVPVAPVIEEKAVPVEESKQVEVTTATPTLSPRPTIGIPNRRMQPRFDIPQKKTFIPKEVSEVAVPLPPRATATASPGASEVSDVVIEVPEMEEERQSPQTQEEYKARITEIKHVVHEKIGNPAALMGAHNIHGKRYMSALLSALKATTAGSLDEMHEALEALESVSKALLEDAPLESAVVSQIEKRVVNPSPTHIPVEEVVPPSPQTYSEEEAKEEIVVVEAVPEEKPVRHMIPHVVEEESPAPPIPHIPDVSVFNRQKVAPKIESEEKPQEFQKPIILKEEGRVPLHKYSVSEIMATHSTHESEQIVHEENEAPSHEEKKWQNNKVDEPVITTSVLGGESHHPRTKHVYKAIATSDPEEMKDVIGIDTQAVTSEQTELYSPKITEALQQLLHEWTIFGGSGLFGIGPGGSEHPLYIKLSLLSMGELLAGRWEKADPKLIKVIKQYVDAWRHEQGIAYTIDETFEHYLRRVVQKILKRQGGL